MDPQFIRWSDKNIGRPACFVLTLQRRFSVTFRKNASRGAKPSRIVFIKLVEQGSTVLACPAINKAREMVGRENIYFIVFKKNRPILDILDLVPPSNIIEVDPGNMAKFIRSAIKAIARVRRERIDAAVDMEFFSRASAILAYLSGADKRVGLHRFNCEGPYRGDLFTHRLTYNPYLHTSLFFASLVEALNHTPAAGNAPMVFEIPEITGDPPVFSAAEIEKESLIKKIAGLKKSPLSRPVIILNPKIKDVLPQRRWPGENFIRLGLMLRERFPRAAIILTGSPEEKEQSDIMASRIPGAVSLAGRTSLRELLVLYSISDVLVTSDSGAAHVSALTPVKSIVLFGPETPLLYGPPGGKTEAVSARLACSPCLSVYNARKSPCASAACLKSIRVDDIFKRVVNLLDKY